MPLKIKKPAPAEVTTTVTESKSGAVLTEKVETAQVEVPKEVAKSEPVDRPWCEVGVEVSYTHNLGNFNSTRMAVSLKVPCLHEEVNDVFDYAKDWVEKKLEGMVEEVVK